MKRESPILLKQLKSCLIEFFFPLRCTSLETFAFQFNSGSAAFKFPDPIKTFMKKTQQTLYSRAEPPRLERGINIPKGPLVPRRACHVTPAGGSPRRPTVLAPGQERPLGSECWARPPRHPAPLLRLGLPHPQTRQQGLLRTAAQCIYSHIPESQAPNWGLPALGPDPSGDIMPTSAWTLLRDGGSLWCGQGRRPQESELGFHVGSIHPFLPPSADVSWAGSGVLRCPQPWGSRHKGHPGLVEPRAGLVSSRVTTERTGPGWGLLPPCGPQQPPPPLQQTLGRPLPRPQVISPPDSHACHACSHHRAPLHRLARVGLFLYE